MTHAQTPKRKLAHLQTSTGDIFHFAGGANPDQHLRPGHAAQHQVQQRGELQKVLWLCHRPPQVCFWLIRFLQLTKILLLACRVSTSGSQS